jgi:subtilisin family serine protease
MSDEHDDHDNGLSRRTFVKTTGVAAAATGLGASAGAASAGETPIDKRLLNWRRAEAAKVWARGFRGRPDRSLALTDSGISGRHADLGPWNDAVIKKTPDGMRVTEKVVETRPAPVPTYVTDRTEQFSGTNAGAGAVGLNQNTSFFTLRPPGAGETVATVAEFSDSGTVGPGGPDGTGAGQQSTTQEFVPESRNGTDMTVDEVDATLTWTPQRQDNELILEKQVGDGWEQVAISQNANISSGGGERIKTTVVPSAKYRFVVETWANASADYQLEVDLNAVETDGSGRPEELVDPGYRIDATISWNTDTPGPQPASVEMSLLDSNGDPVANAGPDGLAVSDDNEASLSVEVPDGDYQFQVTTWRGVAEWEIDADVNWKKKQYEDGELVTEVREVTNFEDYEGQILPSPGDVDTTTPKVVGWYDAGPRRGSYDKPRDGNGHGSHVSGIMAGTGRGSTLSDVSVNHPRAILAPTDVVEYEVDVAATGTAFASALGDNLIVEIVGPDGRTVHETPVREDSVIADEPAVHANGTRTYTVRVKPAETGGTGARAFDGNPTAARVDTVAVGSYADADSTLGSRASGNTTVHPGLAPNQSLVGLQGLSAPTDDLNQISAGLSSELNVRAVNMSWGPVGGLPIGPFGGVVAGLFTGDVLGGIKTAAENGILTVAAAGNAFTPANGNGYPAVTDESISVAATGPLDGITSYSAGGIGALDEDGEGIYMKPDVTAPGGDAEPDGAGAIAAGTIEANTGVDVPYPVPNRYELVRSVRAADPDADQDVFEPRDYASFGGTSMASPYVCGTSGLVAEAMEFAAPDSISLPEPAAAGFDDVMRLKQVILATATETAFTAAPYHTAKNVPSTPTYDFGARDPYEGYGRANPDAAVDAVINDLFDPSSPAFDVEDVAAVSPLETDDDGEDGPMSVSTTLSGAVGLNVPFDNRALAGYVEAKGGTLDVSVQVDRLSGGNAGMAMGNPHIDLFVYDAENPNQHGEPNIVEAVAATQGSGSLTVDVPARENESDDPNTRTYYVVAKLVNVPGVVNGYDVQAHLSVDVAFAAADVAAVTTEFTASGSRSDDGAAFTGGQTDQVQVTVEGFDHADEVAVTDQVPTSWTVDEEYGDVDRFDADNGVVHFEGTVTAEEVGANGSVTLSYFAEAPEGAENAGRYTFGPATATVVDADVPEEDADGDLDGDGVDTFGGTDTNTVVGPSTET